MIPVPLLTGRRSGASAPANALQWPDGTYLLTPDGDYILAPE